MMTKSGHPTEEDFQNYFENSFTNDAILFKEHIQMCRQCRESFHAYSSVWSFVRNDYKIESLEIDLATAVTEKVSVKKRNISVFELALLVMFILFVFIAVIICLRFLAEQSEPILTMAIFIIPLFFYFMLSLKEISIIRNKFSVYQD
jgi:hypothetical protein